MSSTLDRRTRGQRASGPPDGSPHQSGDSRRHRWRLLDRDAYLSELELLFSRDWSYPVGPMVVEGVAGVGKTALAGAACRIAAEAGWAVLRARGDSLKTEVPHFTLRQLVDSSGDPAGRSVSTVEKAAVLASFEDLVANLSADRGVLICVDDAQWADEESCEWLYSGLGPWPPQRKLRLLVSFGTKALGLQARTVERIASEPSARIMSLGALSPKAIALLAGTYFDSAADQAFIYACQDETGGNPALLLALFRQLSLEGFRPDAQAAERARSVISGGVARSIRTRLSGLPSEAVSVLEAVAVAGDSVELDVIAEVSQLDPRTAGAAADALTDINLLAYGRPLRFQQAIVRRTAYAEIAPTRAAEIHLRLAKSLKSRGSLPEQIAEHLSSSEPHGDEWVVNELENAGNRALDAGAPHRAVRYLRRALLERPIGESRPGVLLGLSQAEAAVDSRSALEHLRQAVTQGADPRAAAHTAIEVARFCVDLDIRSRLGPTLESLTTLLADAEIAEKVDLAVAAALLGCSPTSAVTAAETVTSVLTSASYPRSHSEREALALLAVVNSGNTSRASGTDVAVQVRAALLGVDFLTEEPLKLELWSRCLLALVRAGEFEEADRNARGAQAMARLRHLERADAVYSLTLALSLALQGSLAEANEAVSAALSTNKDHSWGRRSEALSCLVGVLLDMGRLDEAEAAISESVTIDRDDPPLAGPTLLEQRGRLRSLQGRVPEALADLFAAGRRAEDCHINSPVATIWRREAALSLSAAGRHEEAVRLAEENLELARAHGGGWVVGSALHTLAAVGAPTECADRLEEALELLEDSPARLELARVKIDLGRAVREAGSSPSRAREMLRSGADIALQRGAAPLVSKASSELRLSGARPRRLAMSGTASLTSSERQIVSLAGEGYSNIEIAAKLYLAEKTVEGHLGRAFRKLGVRSRRELRGLSELLSEDFFPADGSPSGMAVSGGRNLPLGRT